jgi:hypothetical protein
MAQSVKLMAETAATLGVCSGWDGWVKHQDYQLMKTRLAQCRERFLNWKTNTEGEREQWAKGLAVWRWEGMVSKAANF